MRSLYLSTRAVFPPSEPSLSQQIYFLASVMETVWSAFPGFQPRDTKSAKIGNLRHPPKTTDVLGPFLLLIV